MFCEKCGTHNDDYAIVCKNCGEPLNIEKNVIIEGHKNHGTHVDIVDITSKNNDDNQYKATRKMVFILVIVLLFLSGIGCLFIGYQVAMGMQNKTMLDEYNLQFKKYAKNYEFNYHYMQIDKLTKYAKNRIKKRLDIKEIDSTIAIVENKKIIAHQQIDNVDSAINFLKHYKLLPDVIEDTAPIIKLFNNSIKNDDASVIYIPSIFNQNIENQDQILKELCQEQNLKYINIHGYALNEQQLLKIYKTLGFSEVQSQLIVLVKKQEIVGVLEDIKNNKQEYLTSFNNYEFIDNINHELINIDKQQFITYLSDDNNHIILIDKANAKYSNRIIETLKNISNDKKIDINYLVITENDTDIINIIRDKGITESINNLPVLVLVEKGKILNSIIGLAENDYYIEQLTEYGFIR